MKNRQKIFSTLMFMLAMTVGDLRASDRTWVGAASDLGTSGLSSVVYAKDVVVGMIHEHVTQPLVKLVAYVKSNMQETSTVQVGSSVETDATASVTKSKVASEQADASKTRSEIEPTTEKKSNDEQSDLSYILGVRSDVFYGGSAVVVVVAAVVAGVKYYKDGYLFYPAKKKQDDKK